MKKVKKDQTWLQVFDECWNSRLYYRTLTNSATLDFHEQCHFRGCCQDLNEWCNFRLGFRTLINSATLYFDEQCHLRR